jgi:hypothetical protein
MQLLTMLCFTSVAAFAVAYTRSPGNAGSAQAAHADQAPAPQNERLAKLAGDYDWTSTFDMGDGTKPIESHGTAKFASVLGGRFLRQEESGGMAGQPFEALKLYGYNTSASRYEALWVYTGSTAMMQMNGASADGGKTILFDATYATDARGGHMDFAITLAEIDADRFTIELAFKAPAGAPSGRLKSTYTRKK